MENGANVTPVPEVDFQFHRKRYDDDDDGRRAVTKRQRKSKCHKLYAFVSYTGGKHYLKNFLQTKCPDMTRFDRYVEPFLGAGSLFLTLQPRVALLNDINPYLPLLFYCLKYHFTAFLQQLDLIGLDDVDGDSFHRHLVAFNVSRQHHHPIPVTYSFGSDQPPLHAAALFYYLLKRCFNGNAHFTPEGSLYCTYWRVRQKVALYNKALLSAVHEYLVGADITFRHGDFKSVLDLVRPGDFLYLDPPYLGNAFKTTQSSYYYTSTTDTTEPTTSTSASVSEFSEARQYELVERLMALRVEKGVSWIMTNSFSDAFVSLFREWPYTTECLHLKNVRGFAVGQGRLKLRSDLFISSISSA